MAPRFRHNITLFSSLSNLLSRPLIRESQRHVETDRTHESARTIQRNQHKKENVSFLECGSWIVLNVDIKS